MTLSIAVRQDFDGAKAKAFAGQMLTALNNAALVLMTSIGHRTGLFDALAANSPTTSEALAAKAGLAERYVREWLAVMTTARVVDYDPRRRSYVLPAEHAAFLTRNGSIKNIAVSAQFPSVVAAVEDQIVARFRDGNGMHYHHYKRFHEVMAEASEQSIVRPLVDHILPLAPGLTARLAAGIDVIDVGCGAGKALLLLAERFPKSRFLGVDLCPDAFGSTVEEARERGLDNLTFRTLDLATVPALGTHDLALAFDAIHDQRDPQGVLGNIRRSLRQDGVFLMVEFDGSSRLEGDLGHPVAPFLYMMSTMHCTPVSLGQGGDGLGTMWGTALAGEMLNRAGFRDVQISRLPHDTFNAYFVATV